MIYKDSDSEVINTVKAAIPYLEPRVAMRMSIVLKLLEIKNIIEYYKDIESGDYMSTQDSGRTSGKGSGMVSDIVSDIVSDVVSGMVSGKGSGKDTGKDSGKDSGMVSDIVSGMVSNVVSGMVSDAVSGRGSGKDTGRDSGRNTGRDSVKDNGGGLSPAIKIIMEIIDELMQNKDGKSKTELMPLLMGVTSRLNNSGINLFDYKDTILDLIKDRLDDDDDDDGMLETMAKTFLNK